jgi:tRNA (guanine10-N2)-dimethyltransferase
MYCFEIQNTPINNFCKNEPLVTMKLLFLLSGEHPTLPRSELSCVGEVTDSRPQVAVAQCKRVSLVRRLAMSHAVMEYLGECPADIRSFTHLLKDLSITSGGPFVARVKKIEGAEITEPTTTLEHLMGAAISGTVSLEHPSFEFRAIFSQDRCYIGKLLCSIDRGSFETRNPGKRTFFHPGVMMPRMARAIVNISQVAEGERFLDPFCGTGGVLIEAGMVGATATGGDMDIFMVQGTRRNLPGADLFLADAGNIPLKTSSVDAVATDLPYGQSSSIMAEGIESLYRESLIEIRRVLKPGKRAVIVTHRDIRVIASPIMEICEFHEQRVHKSLTRRIMVLGT